MPVKLGRGDAVTEVDDDGNLGCLTLEYGNNIISTQIIIIQTINIVIVIVTNHKVLTQPCKYENKMIANKAKLVFILLSLNM